jgi:hypothetical protein
MPTSHISLQDNSHLKGRVKTSTKSLMSIRKKKLLLFIAMVKGCSGSFGPKLIPVIVLYMIPKKLYCTLTSHHSPEN